MQRAVLTGTLALLWGAGSFFGAAGCGSHADSDSGGGPPPLDSGPSAGGCSDGLDDDGDGRVDYPLDPGCDSAADGDETDDCPDGAACPLCSNGLDDDGDGRADYGLGGVGGDPGCTFAADGDETDVPECQNGIDDDGDGLTDFPDDPGCSDADDVTELQQACKNGLDDDGDGLVDFPDDPDCDDPLDMDEQAPAACGNGADDDGDALVDFPGDPGCDDAFDENEFNPADCLGVPVEDLTETGSATFATSGPSLQAGSCGGASAPEGIGYIAVPADLTLLQVYTFGTSFESDVYVQAGVCGDPAAEIGCSNEPVNGYLQIDDVPAGEYWVFVDGETATDTGAAQIGFFGVIAPVQPCEVGNMHFVCDGAAGFTCMEVSPGAGTICTAGTCSNGLDDDGDGVTDWPWEPGCDDATDASETDPPTTPDCVNGADDDGDALVDYPADPGCEDAADTNEIDECVPGLQVADLPASGTAIGTLPATSLMTESCAPGFAMSGGEVVYVVDAPALSSFTASTAFPGTTADTVVSIRGGDCASGLGEIACNDNVPPTFSASSAVATSVPAGTYFIIVDEVAGFGIGSGYELHVSGVIAGGQPCDPASTVFVCEASTGFTCADPGTGTTVCVAGQCSNTLDDDGDALADWPAEPGCASLADNDETDPTPLPVCYDGVDNDGDAIVDYPADPGCFYAADATEEDECIPGVPFIDLPPDGHLLGTTTVTGSFVGSCTMGFTTSGGEDVVIFTMPTTAAVTLTTNLAGTTFDTGIYLRSLCDDTTSEIACNDNAPGSFSGSTINTTLVPGTYFLFIDGLNGAAGSYELQVSGTVAGGAPCDPTSLIFTCDAGGGFSCSDPGTGTFVCTAGPCSNTLDDDGDLLVDYPADPGCTSLADPDETDPAVLPQCANGLDDDGDALIDYPADTGCTAASDDDEACTLFGTDTYGYTGCEEMLTAATVPCPNIGTTGTAVTLFDDSTSSVPIGFTFDFYGTAYTTANVGSNGKLFTASTSFGNACLPNAGEGTMIAPWWDDLYPPAGGTVRYLTTGTAPNRTFEVMWNIQHYAGSPGTIDVRLMLNETTNQIDVCYVDTTFGTADDNGASATIGIQNGTSALQYSCNSAVITPGLVLHYIHP